MIKITLAPDSFKDSLSASEVCDCMEKGILEAAPDCQIAKVPLADGGEGTVDALVTATQGKRYHTNVSGPLGESVRAQWGILGNKNTAVIEMAQASGLPLVPVPKRNPRFTTTYGTGELILQAIDRGCREIIMGIGGSATTDCGCGMAQALGVKFYDQNDQLIDEHLTGETLIRVSRIDVSVLDPRIWDCHFTVACDVSNPLLGANGAVAVYGPQKGAQPNDIIVLEQHLSHIIDLVEKNTNKNVRNVPGAGAAGGLGAGLLAFTLAELQSGIDIVLHAVNFEQVIAETDLLITGEGKLDDQTAQGKTISGVLARARHQKIPVIALAGTVMDSANSLYEQGMTAMFSICRSPTSLEEALKNAPHLIEKTAEHVTRTWLASGVRK